MGWESGNRSKILFTAGIISYCHIRIVSVEYNTILALSVTPRREEGVSGGTQIYFFSWWGTKGDPKMAILEVYKGKYLIGSFRLDEDFVSISRAGSNEIVLPDRDLKVSRYHAVLIRNPYDPDGYILRDLSSSWGTKIGKEFIFQTPLKDGDIIDIVNFRLKYVATGQRIQEPFMIISDSREMEPLTFPSEIGEQETFHGERNGFSKGIKDFLAGLIPGLPPAVQILFEEMLGRVETAAKVEDVIANAMPLLFYGFFLEVIRKMRGNFRPESPGSNAARRNQRSLRSAHLHPA